MIYVASVLGFGDSLITLSLLEKVPSGAAKPAVVLGTKVTTEVANTLVSADWWERRTIFERIPGFYDLRVRGGVTAMRDFATFFRFARKNLTGSDVLMLEKADWRAPLLSLGHGARVVAAGGGSAYQGRKALVEELFGTTIRLAPCGRPATWPRRVVVNPSARHESRCLSDDLLRRMLAFLHEHGSQVVLVDPTGRYRPFANDVDEYLLAPGLGAAAASVRQGEFYIGPDSFVLHLAYYYGKPFFTFFLPDWFYFAPPGTLELGNYAVLDSSLDAEVVVARMRSLFGGSTGARGP